MRLRGKRVFLTGGASGIGSATVDLLAREGASVYATDLVAGGDVHACDVTCAEAVGAAVGQAATALGGIDLCVNVAGVNVMARVEDVTTELLLRHLRVNFIGAVQVTQAAIPHLKASGGNIVSVASITAIHGQPYNSAYSASKAALLQFMKAIAIELAPSGIRVNCVCPGGVDTPLTSAALASLPPDADAAHMARLGGVLPGLASPVDVAEAIAYLGSDAASSVTGTALVVDRGTLC